MCAVVAATSSNTLSDCWQSRKGDVYMPMATGDTELVRAVAQVLRERNISHNRAAQQMGIAQTTLSRLIRIVEAGKEVDELRPRTREALTRYLAASDSEIDARALAVGRQIAANILEEIAHLLRRGSEAPDQLLPPTVRRLLGAGSTGSDRDAERRAALEDLLDDLGRQADEDPERRERA